MERGKTSYQKGKKKMKSMLKARNWKESKEALFETFFMTIVNWNLDGVTDDRRIAIYRYNRVMEALAEMPEEPSEYHKEVMNKALDESFKEIAAIVNRYRN